MNARIELAGDAEMATAINAHCLAQQTWTAHNAAQPEDHEEAEDERLCDLCCQTFEVVRHMTPLTAADFLEKARTMLADPSAGDYLPEVIDCINGYWRTYHSEARVYESQNNQESIPQTQPGLAPGFLFRGRKAELNEHTNRF